MQNNVHVAKSKNVYENEDYICGTLLNKNNSCGSTIQIANIVFSERVLSMLRNLPVNDRLVITKAIVSEFIFGETNTAALTGMQHLIYYMVADNIRRSNIRGLSTLTTGQ